MILLFGRNNNRVIQSRIIFSIQEALISVFVKLDSIFYWAHILILMVTPDFTSKSPLSFLKKKD